MAKAVLLLSGGLDSYTAGAMMRAEGYELFALTVRYGQVHAREIEAAREVAKALGVARHVELDVDLAAFGGSALLGDGEVPKNRPLENDQEIPVTYVPARNTILLSMALGWAEVVGAERHRDRRERAGLLRVSRLPSRVPRSVRTPGALATRVGVEGQSHSRLAPLVRLSKADIIRQGLALGLDYGLTHSCYDPATRRRAVRRAATAAACARRDLPRPA